MIAADLRKRRPKPHTTWRLDEVYLKIAGRMVYLWRAVDAEGEVLDVLVQSRRNKRAVLKLMRKLLKKYGFVPDKLVTDDLKSYAAAASELSLARRHERGQWRNNRAENSHQPLRLRAKEREDLGLFSIRAVVVKRFQANNSNFCRSRARASLRDQPLALPAWDQQEETEQSDFSSVLIAVGAIDTRVQSELVSSIVSRGTSLRWIVVLSLRQFGVRRSDCRRHFPCPAEPRFHPSTCDA